MRQYIGKAELFNGRYWIPAAAGGVKTLVIKASNLHVALNRAGYQIEDHLRQWQLTRRVSQIRVTIQREGSNG